MCVPEKILVYMAIIGIAITVFLHGKEIDRLKNPVSQQCSMSKRSK